MRYAIASVFTLLVVGMASAGPSGPATTADQRVAAPQPTRCEVVPEPIGVAPARWDELDADPRPSESPSADAAAGVTAALHELVACVNTRPGLQTLLGPGTEHTVLVWIGEPWLLPDDRVAAPIITRRGVRAEAWRLVIVERQGGRYRVDAVMAIDPQSGTSLMRAPRPAA